MTSSMLAGERRWASARRGGMTVLGKVAVPKPLNLPSQKLENHGLDPNVEIVPKGSLSWGSRPSSSTSNPWGSSAVSPNSDGNANTNTVSPRHPSGRPTSGGGLSRPSTGGSDRVHESSWGPNSRPSSASGVLTSNQSSLTVSRPLSAETRPGSSHLSRFAEPVFDNSMAWGPNGTVDKLSIPSKGNDFSLSSGDFPTLGSEKDNPPKSGDPHDQDSHVRPGSASGRGAHTNERNEMSHADHKGGTVDTWTREGPPHMGENWQGDPHQYGPPQHYDAWRGPPMNAPGVWYRGPPPPPPPAGPPYTPVPHGGYPMEPFPYYRGPQIPPPLANSQGPGPRPHHPRNNDFYRPNMPDAFIRPGMPMRPGFYPGPVPYEGYFGPPMGYNPNPNDRDNPFMGMPPPGPHGHGHGPPVYNMCPPQNPSEINDPHFRGGGPRGPNMFVPEHSDSVPPEEPRGPYKVLRKRENERPNADVDEGNWDQMQHTSTINSLAVEKNENQPRPSFHKNDHRSTDSRRGEDVVPSRRNNNTLVENPSSRMLGNQKYPCSNKPSNESWGKRSETVTPVVPEVAQDVEVNSKDPSLIQKIEGLNAKVRASDVATGNLREEPKNSRFVNQKDNSTFTFGTISNTEDVPNPRDINAVRGDNTNKSTTGNAPLISRQPHHGVRKGSSSNQNNDGWRKKPSILGSDSSQNVGQVSAENPEAKNNTVESLTPMVDSSDGQAQRARMRELAKQRAIQLQKEEEERIKEQKAKALAKLEELNRRTLAADGTTQTAEGTTTTSVSEPENVEVDQKPTEPETDGSKTEVASSEVETKSQPAVQVSKNIQPSVHVSKNSQQEPAVKQTDAENRTVPSSTQPRKRNNKSSKSRPKTDDTSAALVDADVAKQEAPLLPLPSPPPQVELESSKDNKDSVQSNNQYNKGQHQHQRRMARNNHPQAARSADRFHGNDGVMWAPVRANKEERGGDEYTHDDVAKSSGNSVQSNLKSRRAEMERYVPKAVAKELAQQGTTTTTTTNQQSASPSSPVKEDTSHKEEIISEVPVPDNKQNRPMKSQQHKKSNPKQEVVKAVVTSETHEWDPSDGWFMPEYPPPATEVVKEEGGGNKGKKPVSSYNKTQRSIVKNHEEVETERPTSAKENRSSHWQPKPQGYNAEHGGERKPRGGRIHSPNNMEDEQAQFDQQQQQSGFRKYGGGGGGSQSNRGGGRHNVNRERQPRQNLHYEYQPVGVGANSNSNSTSSSNNNNNNADGSGNTGGGPRYKGQGQGQPRRGGGSFYGRQ
ncbi:hypothetical protein LXL04_009525 [Taraxacum kok-saghyz]